MFQKIWQLWLISVTKAKIKMLYKIYQKRIDEAVNNAKLLKETQLEIDKEIKKIPAHWADLFFQFLYFEPEAMWDRKVAEIVFKKLEKFLNVDRKLFATGLLSAIEYWFRALEAFNGLAETVREIGPIDYLPEIKTRLYRIPTYSQLLEAVLANLFRTIRDLAGAVERKDFAPQTTLANLRDLLVPKGFGDLFRWVDVDVRNAINHGGILVSPWDVTFIYFAGAHHDYKEKKWTTRDPIGEVVYSMLGARKPHFDDYIEGAFDAASGIFIGFLRFFTKHPEIISELKDKTKMEDSLSFKWLARFLSYPGASCIHIDTGIAGASPQLNLHFLTTEAEHGKLHRHALEIALIAREWSKNFNQYMVGFQHPRMMPGIARFKAEELDAVLEGQLSPVIVMKQVIERGDAQLLFEASDEEIDLEAVRRFQFPLLGGEGWKVREIVDVSNPDHKRIRANIYIRNAKFRRAIMKVVRSALIQLKQVENPPQPTIRIKHGTMPASAVYLQAFRNQRRRRDRIITPENSNFLAIIEWHDAPTPDLKHGGIPESIWERLDKEIDGEILYAWNPNLL